jgi:pilus assembly protein Flp/PilA
MSTLYRIGRDFLHDEEGVALTEYLVLLGLLVGGAVAAVTAAGGNLSAAWESWGSWWTTNTSAPSGGTGG